MNQHPGVSNSGGKPSVQFGRAALCLLKRLPVSLIAVVSLLLGLLATAGPTTANAASTAMVRERSGTSGTTAHPTKEKHSRPRPRSVQDQYIIGLRDEPSDAAFAAMTKGVRVIRRYRSALHGFAARLSKAQVEKLRKNTAVVSIEPDLVVTSTWQMPRTSQGSAPWGLDRIDQRDRPLNDAYNYNATGQGVTLYVIDSGVRADHQEFGNRVLPGYDAYSAGDGRSDCVGHGTYVAAIAGGATYGVAKKVVIRPVRVLGCDGSGTLSQFLSGVDWVQSVHTAGQPAIANISGGFSGVSYFADSAVESLIASGVTTVVAAGNDADDACYYSPGRAAGTITVAATDSADYVPYWSNEGACVDIFAPGVAITSALPTTTTSTGTYDGTSASTPFVSGAAALVLQASRSSTPAQVRTALLNNATTGRIRNEVYLSPDRLLYTTAFSAPAAVAPANDAFANAVVVPSAGGSVSGSNVYASMETGEPSHASGNPVYSVWWTFTAMASGTMSVSTAGSNFDTVLGVYTGDQVDSLVTVASNDDNLDPTSRVSFSAVGGTTYRIAVAGYMDAAGSITLSVTAPPPTTYELAVSKDGDGSGTVSSSPSVVNCGGTCSAPVTSGTQVVLTATPAAGSIFSGWSGEGCSGTGTCTVTMFQARSVTATFSLANALTVLRSGTGSGSVTSNVGGINCGATCSTLLVPTTSVTLTATPSVGSLFTGWSGEGCTGTGTCDLTMDTARTVTAAFELGYILTVSRSGSGSGSVVSDVGGIDCGVSCTTTQLVGTTVVLTATPAAGSRFIGWAGACSGDSTCTVTLTAARSITARFAKLPTAKAAPSSGVVEWAGDPWPEVPSVRGFRIDKSLDGVTWTRVASVGSSARKQIARGLTNGLSYRFRVAAFGSTITGNWIETDWVIPRAPASAPRAVVLTPRDKHVIVRWTVPATDGASPILDYRLQRSTNGRTWTTITDGVSTDTTFDVTGLRNGTRYYFRVAAINAIGTGANSSPKYTKPYLTKPGAPRITLLEPGQNTMRLVWSAPTRDGGSAVTDYRVQYSTNGRTWTTAPREVSLATELTVMGLRGGTSYRFRVAAVNIAGTGTYTYPRVATPLVPPNFNTARAFVGVDAQPGRYIAYSGLNCAWSRRTGATIEESSIVGSGFVAKGPAIVDILPGDLAFDSTGCGRWYQLVNPAPIARIGNGNWLVTGQMLPGVWTSYSTAACTWSRLSAWTGVAGDVLQTATATGTVVVIVDAGDVGFSSAGCGTWSRTG